MGRWEAAGRRGTVKKLGRDGNYREVVTSGRKLGGCDQQHGCKGAYQPVHHSPLCRLCLGVSGMTGTGKAPLAWPPPHPKWLPMQQPNMQEPRPLSSPLSIPHRAPTTHRHRQHDHDHHQSSTPQHRCHPKAVPRGQGSPTSVTSGPKTQPTPPRPSFSLSPSCITGSDHSTSHATRDAPTPGDKKE